jgi:hypothetical protein
MPAQTCAGLYITPGGDLQYLRPRACTGAALSGSWPEQERTRLYTKSLDGAVFDSMTLVEEACQAMGVTGAGTVRVSLLAHHPVAEQYDATDPSSFLPVNSSSCLINFQ